jgi:hypothetical protein
MGQQYKLKKTPLMLLCSHNGQAYFITAVSFCAMPKIGKTMFLLDIKPSLSNVLCLNAMLYF